MFNELRTRLQSFKLDEGLIFLNYVHQATHKQGIDEFIYNFAQENPGTITDFKIEFLSKWLIIESAFTSSSILAPATLNWDNFLQIIQLFDQIDDPITRDPDFQNRNPVEVFIRLAYQQLPGQQRIPLQHFGSAYLIFQEAAARVAGSIGYDLPARFQQISQLSIQEFMQLGFLFFSAGAGQQMRQGLVDQAWLNTARGQGVGLLTEENVEHFLALASSNHETFRQIAAQPLHQVADPNYILYEFNPLKKSPLIQIREDRWVAPNPDLIVDRVTWGIYYDLLDADGTGFTERFGRHIFEEYIGDLLKSVYPDTNIHRERVYGHPERRGPADWVIVEDNVAIFVECKSLIPNLGFVSIADQTAIEQYANRVANAVQQTVGHIAEIQAGEPALQDFADHDSRIIILTFGQIQTVNTVFFQPEIESILSAQGIGTPQYVVFSLQEFEHLLSLVERGVTLVDILDRFRNEPLGEALEPYGDMLADNALPSLVARKGRELIDTFRLSRRPHGDDQ
ncbi:MAG: hypothetical protein KDI79_08505 [Anaerolineae bacterium]|nr:hypothetical protein [Anaerolineae bacterium]